MTGRPDGDPRVDRPGASDPHAVTRGLRFGTPVADANAAVVLVHGRGGSPEGMSEFARGLARPGIAWLAPRAFGASWYPQSFLAPLDTNQPWLDSALRTLERLTNELFREAQLDRERVVLLGFSQGACLATEFMARTGGRWGGLAALSGGLIGPPGTERSYHRSLEGTPAFFGCGDPDLHIPRKRVEESGQVFSGLGADVDVRFYPGLGHAVNTDEVDEVRRIIEAL